jgi:hypothetical protein
LRNFFVAYAKDEGYNLNLIASTLKSAISWGWPQEYHFHWHDTYQIIIDFFGTIVIACISNQCKGHWLLNDALNFVISMSLKFKDKINFAPK